MQFLHHHYLSVLTWCYSISRYILLYKYLQIQRSNIRLHKQQRSGTSKDTKPKQAKRIYSLFKTFFFSSSKPEEADDGLQLSTPSSSAFSCPEQRASIISACGICPCDPFSLIQPFLLAVYSLGKHGQESLTAARLQDLFGSVAGGFRPDIHGK